MSQRFFVDHRTGCVAVRDSEYTDPNYSGLHEDTEGVVKFWMGTPVTKKCECCGHESSAGWTVSYETVAKARALCDQLNANPDDAIITAATLSEQPPQAVAAAEPKPQPEN